MSSSNSQGAEFSRRSLATAIGIALAAGSAQAGTITVTTPDDAGPGSFREAIQTANNNAGADTIDFSAISGQTITLASNLPVIDDDLTLQGSEVTLDGDGQYTCLAAYGSPDYLTSLAVNDMTVTACTGQLEAPLPETRGGAPDAYGGGIYLLGGSLEVNNSVITGNAARPDNGSYSYELFGGGIAVKYGSLTVTDSTISDNSAIEGGGIFHFGLNYSQAERGTGAIPSALTITGSTISGNTADENGGGLYAFNLYSTATIEQTEIVDNQAYEMVGGLFLVGDESQFQFSDSTISGNSAGNAAEDIGGIGGALMLNKYPGSTTLVNNTISNNSAPYGAGLYLIHEPGQQQPPQTAGTQPPVTLTGQTITGNTASNGPGGGLTAIFELPGTLLATNSIIAGNSAAVAGTEDLSATLPQSGNRIDAWRERLPEQYRRDQRGGGPVPGNTTFDVNFSVVGVEPTDGSNFDPDMVTTDLLGDDPLLGALADNGGPTRTHLPAANSPAVNIIAAADGCGTAPFDADQRGEARPEISGTLCDAGSVERGAPPLIDVNPDINFGPVEVGNNAGPETVTLANTGGMPLEVTSFSALAPFTLDFSDCAASLPFSVAAGASCDLLANFSPASAGPFDQTVTVESNSDAGGDDSFTLTGTGITAGISAAPLDFGALAVGGSAQDTVTVTNTGQGDLSISNLSLSDDAGGAFGLVGDTCGSAITAGNSCQVTISFSPTAGGPFAGSLAVSSNATAEPVEVALTGEGLVGTLDLSPAGLDFGTLPVGQNGSADLTLTNVGDAAIELTGWTTPTAPFSITGGTCPAPTFSLAVGESCTLTFDFAPTAPGDFEELLAFTVDSGSGESSVEANIIGSGSGTAQAVSVPTLNRIGLAIGAGLLALLGFFGLRRRGQGGLNG